MPGMWVSDARLSGRGTPSGSGADGLESPLQPEPSGPPEAGTPTGRTGPGISLRPRAWSLTLRACETTGFEIPDSENPNA